MISHGIADGLFDVRKQRCRENDRATCLEQTCGTGHKERKIECDMNVRAK